MVIIELVIFNKNYKKTHNQNTCMTPLAVYIEENIQLFHYMSGSNMEDTSWLYESKLTTDLLGLDNAGNY